MHNDFEEKISNEFVKNHLISVLKHSNDLFNEFKDTCIEEGIDPENIRKIQFDDAKLYRLLYIAVQEYHNCLSRYLKKSGITLPDLDSLFAYTEDHQD